MVDQATRLLLSFARIGRQSGKSPTRFSVVGAPLTDAAQEAMLSAFAGLDGFDERRPLGPWLKRIAYNRAIDELRRRRRFPDAELNDFASGTALDADLEESARELEEAGGVAAAVARLSPERRVIVVLHYWLDCTREEMAEILDLPVGTVASRLGRALSELRSRLEEEHV